MPDLIRHPDVVPTKVGSHQSLGPGFHREPWIPALAPDLIRGSPE